MYSTPELIARATAWMIENSQIYQVTPEKPGVQLFTHNTAQSQKRYLKRSVEDAVLDHLDSKLRPLIQELFDTGNHFYGIPNAVSGKFVRFTYDHWQGIYNYLTDRKNKVHLVRHITGLTQKTPQSKFVMLEAEVLDLDTMHIDGLSTPVELVKFSRNITFWVSVDQLDRVYPGWQNRLSMAEALQLPKEERLAYTFSTNTDQLAVSMDTVEF